MTETVKLSADEYERKKIAIAGVIDFNDANYIKYSRVKLFKHFGVSITTGYKWFPMPEGLEGEKPGRGRPRSNLNGATKKKASDINLKKQSLSDLRDSEDIKQDNDDIKVILIKADPDEPKSLATTPRRQNPVRNAGRDRKRLKTICNALSDEEYQAQPDSAAFHTPPPSAAPISPPSTGNRGSPQPEQVLVSQTRSRGRPKKAVVQARREMSPEEALFSDDDNFGDGEPLWV